MPTIWVCNDIDQFDPAYLRRFDYSLELEIPPRKVRERILRRQLQSHRIGKAAIKRLASLKHLSPAVVDRAMRVVLGVRTQKARKTATLERLVGNSLRLMGLPDRVAADDAGEDFKLGYVNADMDLGRLAKRLKAAPQRVAMCLYGPPGTGKSAFANFLANEIGKPLNKNRASDLLSPWVGMNERNIAAMFRRAERERAVLLLDEADSFLTQRGVGASSWEVTLVNEMLTQMESFAGIFICSTNLVEQLDEASLRRFALKIKFDFLTREQRVQSLRSYFPLLGDKQLAGGMAAIAALENLAIGDFATVKRQLAVTGEALTPEAFVERLRHECEAKRSSRSRPIGFR